MNERIKTFLKEDGLTVLIIVALIVAFLILRTPGDDFESMSELETELVGGQPTVVEFYSNTCSICLISKPKVDQLERDLVDQAQVVRLNVKADPGKSLAQRWRVLGVPTFFVLNEAGDVVYSRAGAPDIEGIKAAVAAIAP